MDIKCLASSSKGNCYHISDGVTSLLLECGINVRDIQKQIGFSLSEVSGCLVTHEHKDHSKSVEKLMKLGVEVYMSQGTAGALDLKHHRLNILDTLITYAIGTFTVMPFDTQHDAKEPVGYLIYSNYTKEKLLFATDTYYIKYRFKNLNYIMLECNYALDILEENVARGAIPLALKNRLLESHFSLSNVKKFLLANDLSSVKEIYLLHLSDSNSDAKRFKKEIQATTGKAVYVASV